MLVFQDVAELLNNSPNTQIDLTPAQQNPGNWDLHKGRFTNPMLGDIPFEVLYIHAGATKQALEAAAGATKVFKPKETIVVYAPSLRGSFPKTIFEGRARKFWSTREYLAEMLGTSVLENYGKAMKALAPKDYVDPRIKTPSGFDMGSKPRNPLLSFFRDSGPSSGLDGGALGVLLASPGQGKTYMTRQLAATLAREAESIPIYLNSDQWSGLGPNDLSDLWKTISNSFRAFGAPVAWLDGHEDVFVRVTLAAGLFRIIFDGFDEYVLWNHGKVDAKDTFDRLYDLAIATGARILVTSRSSIWHSDIVEEGVQEGRKNLFVYSLLPFDSTYAREYFRKRLDDPARVDRAVSVFTDLTKMGHERQDEPLEHGNLAGRGFVLSLVAGLFEGSEPEGLNVKGNIVDWLIESLCTREERRQKLPTNVATQITILRDLAELSMANESLATADVRDVVAAASGLEGTEADALVRKLRDHPLLEYSPEAGGWRLRYEQIRLALLAGRLLDFTGQEVQKRRQLKGFLDDLRLTGALSADLPSAVVDVVCERGEARTREEMRSEIRDVVASLLWTDAELGRVIAVRIATYALDHLIRSDDSPADRYRMFSSLFPGEAMTGLPFEQTVHRMDFSGKTFEKCRFENVEWRGCVFDAQTSFVSCTFHGGSVRKSPSFGKARFKGCTTDPDAKAFIAAAQVEAGERTYARADLESDVRSVLDRFVRGGNLRTRIESDVKKGKISQSRHKDEILKKMFTSVLEGHEISNVSETGYHVAESSKDDFLFYMQNGVFRGSIQRAVDDLARSLKLS
jgi:hypothetical protein